MTKKRCINIFIFLMSFFSLMGFQRCEVESEISIFGIVTLHGIPQANVTVKCDEFDPQMTLPDGYYHCPENLASTAGWTCVKAKENEYAVDCKNFFYDPTKTPYEINLELSNQVDCECGDL